MRKKTQIVLPLSVKTCPNIWIQINHTPRGRLQQQQASNNALAFCAVLMMKFSLLLYEQYHLIIYSQMQFKGGRLYVCAIGGGKYYRGGTVRAHVKPIVTSYILYVYFVYANEWRADSVTKDHLKRKIQSLYWEKFEVRISVLCCSKLKIDSQLDSR